MLLHFGQGFALTISARVQSTSSEKKMDSMSICDENLQPGSNAIKKSRENGNGSSMAKNARDGPISRSCGSSEEGQDSDDTNNVCMPLLNSFSMVKCTNVD